MNSEVKQQIADLQSSAAALADLLARVRDEGQSVNEDWRWVEQFLKIILKFQKELSVGVQTRDPVVIRHAGGQFRGIRKYFSDMPPDWSKQYKELSRQVSETAGRGGKVASAINPFDAASLAEIQRSL